ncbi:MAG: TraR/DksA family transcriptional regulator [Bacteroidia bacterium]
MKKQKTNISQPNATDIPANHEINNNEKHFGYSDKDLKEFKEIILSKLEEATNHYEFLKETLSGANDHGTDDTSPTFKLLEDASDVSSKEETAQHAIRTQKFIEQLQNALMRIENKTYGICSVSGKLIPRERLKSVPHTTKSLDAKIERTKLT